MRRKGQLTAAGFVSVAATDPTVMCGHRGGHPARAITMAFPLAANRYQATRPDSIRRVTIFSLPGGRRAVSVLAGSPDPSNCNVN